MPPRKKKTHEEPIPTVHDPSDNEGDDLRELAIAYYALSVDAVTRRLEFWGYTANPNKVEDTILKVMRNYQHEPASVATYRKVVRESFDEIRDTQYHTAAERARLRNPQ